MEHVTPKQLDLSILDEMDREAEAQWLDRHRKETERERRICWPEWNGPAVSEDITGRIEIDAGANVSGRYRWAPARIQAINGHDITVEIDYGPDAPEHCRASNGHRLTIDISDVWPPTKLLWEQRHAEEVRNARLTGKHCDCGGPPDHVYGAGFECDPCRLARIPPTK